MPPTTLTRLLSPFLRPFTTPSPSPNILRAFSTTPTPLAGGRPGGKNDKKTTGDPRIALIRYHMQHPKTPRPLRLSRMRALRHWTIHRAWMLARRKRLDGEKKELQRMYSSIRDAVEHLRTMDPSGTKDAGKLYRIAMEKKGVFGHGGVPIEYARFQVDTPGKEAWNHEWTR